MSKMREAFEKWWEAPGSATLGNQHLHAFGAGYQAAIADVKAGGPVLERLMSDPFDERDGYWWDTMKLKSVKVGDKLYKLPEDV